MLQRSNVENRVSLQITKKIEEGNKKKERNGERGGQTEKIYNLTLFISVFCFKRSNVENRVSMQIIHKIERDRTHGRGRVRERDT